MPASVLLRWVLRIGLAAASLLVVRPALACYCLEFCDAVERTRTSEVVAPAEGQETANGYNVVISWNSYASAPADCAFTVEQSTGDGQWVPVTDCEVTLTHEQGGTDTAVCKVTAPAKSPETSQPTDVTYTFRIKASSESRPSAGEADCTTDPIYLPGPLPPPAEPDGERTGPATASLRWSAPSGRTLESGLSTVQQYVVHRYTDSNSTRTVLGRTSTTSYADQGLSATEGYHYEIYAADQYGIGTAAVAYVPATSSGPSGTMASGCNSAAGAAGPLALAMLAAGAFWRRPRRR